MDIRGFRNLGNIDNLVGIFSNKAVHYTSPQSFITLFSNSMAYQLWGIIFNFDLLVHLVQCPKVLQLIIIIQSDIVLSL